MTSIRQLVFTRVLVLISSLRPITGMSLSDQAIKCVQKPKQTVLVQLLDELWRRIWDRSVQPRNLRQLQVALHYERAWVCKNIMRRHMLLVQPRYEAVIATGEDHVCFWTTLTQVNRFRRERDIHSQVKNLSFLKMTPCLNTGV